MQLKKRNISVSGLIISAFAFMIIIMSLSAEEQDYWTILLVLPVLLFLIWDAKQNDWNDSKG